jgi:hypothetical protein
MKLKVKSDVVLAIIGQLFLLGYILLLSFVWVALNRICAGEMKCSVNCIIHSMNQQCEP